MSFSGYRLGMGLRSGGSALSVRSGGLPTLKSSGAVSASKAGGLSGAGIFLNKNDIKDKVSEILGQDKTDSADKADVSGSISGKVDRGLTEEFKQKLEAQAKEDAAAGAYNKDGKAAQLREEQMKKYVSPDRDGAISQANKLLYSALLGSTGITTQKLTGLPYTLSVTKGLSGLTAALYDEYGEKFASYDSKKGAWEPVSTKAESQFQTASSSIYDAAYRAAASGGDGQADGGAASTVDTRA